MQLHCLADASVEELYHVDVSVKSHVDEVFAFDRTVSRLLEVRYLSLGYAVCLYSCSNLLNRWEARHIYLRTVNKSATNSHICIWQLQQLLLLMKIRTTGTITRQRDLKEMD